MDNAEIREQVLHVIDLGKQIYIFSTVDAENRPRSRYMGLIDIEDDYSAFYMGCKANSNKVKEIKANPNAQLLFTTPDFLEIAAISGKASIEDSPHEKRQFWQKNPALAGYFKTMDDPEFAVIRVIPEFAEYYNVGNNFERCFIPWEPMAARKE